MATPTLASLQQLEARFPGGLQDDDTNRALAALEDASAWIRVEAGEDWLDDSGGLETVPAAIVSICCVYLTKQEKAMIHKVAGIGGFNVTTLESPYTPPYPYGDGAGYDAYEDWYTAQ
jgi:hypothetical protein